MAFVRWSSDNGRSDVYCYENVNGSWTTHVAGRKPVDIESRPPDPDWRVAQSSPGQWVRENAAVTAWYEGRDYKAIGLPCDGATFDDAGPKEMVERLKSLKAMGYHVPESVFEVLASEVEDAHE